MEVFDEQRDECCRFLDFRVKLEHNVLKCHHVFFEVVVPLLGVLTELCLVQILSLVVGRLENLLYWLGVNCLNYRLEQLSVLF